MRKVLPALLVVAMALGILVPSAAATPDRTSRTVSHDYVGSATMDWCYGAMLGAGCVHFRTRVADRFISVEIEDASGRDVYAVITQDGHGRGEYPHTAICGRTTEPLRIQGGVPVDVFVWAEVPQVLLTHCSGSGPGLVTAGTVTMTFSETKQDARESSELP
ncbi:MAG TPA: hypothetical protein VNC78_01890 [Actinomycetota bacterium]|nr:hypothetical protein [Actinomycetota bacterium]